MRFLSNLVRSVTGARSPSVTWIVDTEEAGEARRACAEMEEARRRREEKDRIDRENIAAGMLAEEDGDIDTAIAYYEKCVDSRYVGSRLYHDLAVIYRRRKDYANEIRVIDAYIGLYDSINDFLENSQKNRDFYKRRQRAKELMEKQK